MDESKEELLPCEYEIYMQLYRDEIEHRESINKKSNRPLPYWHYIYLRLLGYYRNGFTNCILMKRQYI